MKYFIASDIHGSLYYCEKMLQSYREEKADKLVLLGDILYHGPRNDLPRDYAPKKVIELLNELKNEILAVRGNCDSEVDQMVLNFPLMNTYEIVEADGIKLFATHGHHYSPDNPPPFVEFDVLLNGHTHISMLADCGDYYYANPGSVSIPKGGTTHSYMICEDRMLTIKNLLTMDEIDKMYIKKK